MQEITRLLIATLLVAFALAPFTAEAAAKKKPAVVKKYKQTKYKQTKYKQTKHKQPHKQHYARTSAPPGGGLLVQSAAAVVMDQTTGAVLYEKNSGAVLPIASITKLMTAMVSLDSSPNLSETLTISASDVDTLRGSRSRLPVGTHLPREDLLRLALMSSENRAASALAGSYPGGRAAFVAAMNEKARHLGLRDTRFDDPTGLSAHNVSSARDLVKMVAAAHQYPLIREFTTTAEYQVGLNGRMHTFRNTNSLVKSSRWEIGLSKTGFINEAGKCLVMQAWLNKRPTIIVLLDSWGRLTRIGDATRIKRWVESASLPRPTTG